MESFMGKESKKSPRLAVAPEMNSPNWLAIDTAVATAEARLGAELITDFNNWHDTRLLRHVQRRCRVTVEDLDWAVYRNEPLDRVERKYYLCFMFVLNGMQENLAWLVETYRMSKEAVRRTMDYWTNRHADFGAAAGPEMLKYLETEFHYKFKWAKWR